MSEQQILRRRNECDSIAGKLKMIARTIDFFFWFIEANITYSRLDHMNFKFLVCRLVLLFALFYFSVERIA